MDVVAAPKETIAVRQEPGVRDAPAKEDKPAENHGGKEETKHKVKKTEKSKKQSSGVGAAIFATVIIVLGLAAMATYAYIQTQK